MRALVRLPNVQELLLRDALPTDLRDLAMAYATKGIELASLSPDDLKKFIRFNRELIASSVRYLAEPESGAWQPGDDGWEPITLTAADLMEHDIDPADLEALSAIAGRQKTPNEITALSRFDRGLIPAEEAAQAGHEPGEVTSDYATFRDEQSGAPDGDDGESVRGTAERPTVDRGSRSRVRSRRSSRG